MQTATDIDTLPGTFYEELAQTRWGQYISSAEEATLLTAASRAGGGTAVEVGGDAGRWSQLLYSRGWSVTCIEVREDALALCQERMPSARCLLAKTDDKSWPLTDEFADLLLVYEVEAVTNSAWFLPEAKRVLKGGGILVTTFHNPATIRGAVYRVRTPFSPVRRRQRAYDGTSFRVTERRLEEHGFELLSAEGLCWAPFSRGSDSRLVPLFTSLERVTGLRRLVRFSPLALVVARKR
jgi:SAM-dependent methyltransferase